MLPCPRLADVPVFKLWDQAYPASLNPQAEWKGPLYVCDAGDRSWSCVCQVSTPPWLPPQPLITPEKYTLVADVQSRHEEGRRSDPAVMPASLPVLLQIFRCVLSGTCLPIWLHSALRICPPAVLSLCDTSHSYLSVCLPD